MAATDNAVWREHGNPLVTGSGSGPLQGVRLAVKDVHAVAGHKLGAGNPAWLAEAEPQPAHSWAVAALLAAGADITGIAQTDEFAYSLNGTNAHYGT
ncbi:hypothetical protein HRW07_32615, partial [Streptomyces lunaelactis]|uniref:amidase family protein n=1 Tax=Streptomyces lunaelactis TaxID=1535768 RepID=UPI001D40D344